MCINIHNIHAQRRPQGEFIVVLMPPLFFFYSYEEEKILIFKELALLYTFDLRKMYDVIFFFQTWIQGIGSTIYQFQNYTESKSLIELDL